MYKKDIPYVPDNEKDAYRRERCKLDIYIPDGAGKDFPVLIFLHGGYMEMYEKYIPEELKNKEFAVVAPNYRLSPDAKNPAFTRDAAEAVAWVFANIKQYGGDINKIYVSGHSAGGYLTLMLALDGSYMDKHGIDHEKVLAWFSIGGQTLTHYSIKKERGLNMSIPVIDEYAPVTHARRSRFPIHLITGERAREEAGRWEENALLYSVLRDIGNDSCSLSELQGFDHAGAVAPACAFISHHIKMDMLLKP